ncbi:MULTISPECIES: hypothetical protein [unclassified Pseudomonas]|uniref:hypothetical protein n=1 Tax=unclassified Pseudomonas TaxID=196821 RepID=UPI0021C67F8C|nr:MULTISPECIES: hypothetical protein [unclassified Pseudomonas]MCU1733058.1 hypothetical protein [Pseudomonas sp. 20P_3.2_Bac4]MCU1744159.1 hypothetical protein [Pseudomonas sp. 20P_3.2_Bac5]
MIDVLRSAVEELPHITVDLAYFTGAAFDELIDRITADTQHRQGTDKAYRNKCHQYEGKYEFVLYFHREVHPCRR